MPKVYETERGKPTSSFILYPRWKCPRCQVWRREPMSKSCRSCRTKREEER